MATGRMLKRNISDSRRLSELKTDSARMLWTWIIPFLDVEGRFHASPDMIKGKVVPRLKTFTEINIREYLLDMASVGLIILYKHDDDEYLQYRNFKEFQTLQPKKEGKPLPAPIEKDTTPRQLQDSSNSSPTQFNLKEVNLREANTTEEQQPPVDNFPQEETPAPEKDLLFLEIKNLYFQIQKLYPAFKIQTFFQTYKDKNPKAIIHTFNRLIEQTKKIGEVAAPWAYCEKIITDENMNYNARDHEEMSAEFKKPIDLVKWAQSFGTIRT